MDKQKTSNKPKKSTPEPLKLKIKEGTNVSEFNPLEKLLDQEFIDSAILECLKNNDPEGAMEVLGIYFNALNISKTDRLTDSNLAKTTAYHSLRSKNPTLKTFSKLMHATHRKSPRTNKLKSLRAAASAKMSLKKPKSK